MLSRDDVLRMAREAMEPDKGDQTELLSWWDMDENELVRFAALVAAGVTERCAKVCDTIADDHDEIGNTHAAGGAEHCAAAIRARAGDLKLDAP